MAGGVWSSLKHGVALCGVGVAAMAYHLAPVERTRTRTALRQADFTSIALASAVASDAYGCNLPKALTAGRQLNTVSSTFEACRGCVVLVWLNYSSGIRFNLT